MKLAQVVFLVIALLGHVGFSYGEFVERDSQYGPLSITYDSDTGLEWLDVTQTTNMSVLEIEAELGYGGIYHGWHYATPEDLEILFFYSAGFPPEMYASPDDAPLYQAFLSYFGITVDAVVPGCYLCVRGIFGFHAAAPSPTLRRSATVTVEWDDGVVVGVFAGVNSGMGVIDYGNELTGHWLVRDANSVPNTSSSWGDLKAIYR